MDPSIYLLVGGALFVLMFLWSWAMTKSLMAPAAVFMTLFFIHAFPDPVIRQANAVFAVREDVWAISTVYNVKAYSAALLGLVLGTLIWPAVRPAKALTFAPLFTPESYRILWMIVLGLLGTALFLLAVSGFLGTSRAAFTGYGAKPFEITLAKFIVSYTLLAAVLFALILVFDKSDRTPARVAALLAPFVLVVLMDVLAYGRQASMSVGLAVIIAVLARLENVSWRQILPMVSVIVVVLGFAMLRRLFVGITELSISEAFTVASNDFLFFAITTLAGQEVFQIVVQNFDPIYEPTFNGSTYFWNLVDALQLGWLQPQDYLTPSAWLARNFLAFDSYGRDFSMLAESYINFGPQGYWVFAVIGVIMAALNRLIFTTKSLIWLVWGVFMIANITIGLRNDSLPVLTRAIWAIMPLVLYFTVVRALGHRPQANAASSA